MKYFWPSATQPFTDVLSSYNQYNASFVLSSTQCINLCIRDINGVYFTPYNTNFKYFIITHSCANGTCYMYGAPGSGDFLKYVNLDEIISTIKISNGYHLYKYPAVYY